MGNSCGCCGEDGYSDIDQPDPEIRRRQQMDAAEKRQKDHDTRGFKSTSLAEARRKQDQQEEAERQAERQSGQGEGLRWQVS